jgi:hypothetical protein
MVYLKAKSDGVLITDPTVPMTRQKNIGRSLTKNTIEEKRVNSLVSLSDYGMLLLSSAADAPTQGCVD